MDIIERLDKDYCFLHSKETQASLRSFVLDVNTSLGERFRVWSKFCEKKENMYIIHEGEFGIIGTLVDKVWPYDYEKYGEYNWAFFLDAIEEGQKDYTEWTLDIAMPTTIEFKEMLIQTNFGSFTYDW